MRDSLRTKISQFSSVGGQQQQRAANVRAVEPAVDLPGAGRGKLYMLVEVTGSGGGHPALYRRVLDAAQRAFYESEGSLTFALQRAIRGAHGEMRKINEALPEANWRGGMSCVAINGNELLIAQVNPALVVISHPKTVDVVPPELQPAVTPLGGEERPEIQVERTEIEPGSTVLLAESRWLEHIRPEVLAAAATAETPAQVVDYLCQLAGEADLSALVIGVSEGIPEVAEGAALAPAAWPPEPERAEPEVSAEASAPAGGSRGLFGWRSKPAKAPMPASEIAAPPPTPLPEEYPEFVAPEPAYTAPAAVEERPRRSPWPLVLALVIIPLLIALVVIGMWWFRTRAQEDNFTGALSGATTAIASAQSASDETLVRQRLVAAREYLDKAKAIKPDDSRLAPVQARYDENLNRVDKVTPLYGMVPMWSFNGEGLKLTRVLVKGNSAFVLDQGQQQIYRFTLAGLGDTLKPADPPVALARRQQVKDSDQVVADFVDMTWIDAVSNQRSRLLTLDSGGALYSYDVTFGPARIPIGGRDQWGTPQLMASYNGNLYLLDAKANQIWRYKPTEKGYENAPDRYFAEGSQVDLSGAQSMVIDGNIWVLYADGRLLKFFTGKQQPFEFRGLPTPLSGATAVVASAEGDQLYVADSGNGRIVEFNKAGQFQRQFRPAQGGTALHDMRGLYLDEAGGAFYILTDKQLFKATLPRTSAAPAATTAPAASASTPAAAAATPTAQK